MSAEYSTIPDYLSKQPYGLTEDALAKMNRIVALWARENQTITVKGQPRYSIEYLDDLFSEALAANMTGIIK